VIVSVDSTGAVSVILAYHSGFGHTARLAEAVRDGAAGVPDTAATMMSVDAVTEQQWIMLDEADAIIFGSPTYMGSASAAFHAFAQASSTRWFTMAWKDKIAAGFTNSAGKGGDKLHTLQYFSVLAAQHGMHWVNLGLPPGWNSSAGSEEDMNRLAVFMGATAQSNADEDASMMRESDLRTGAHLGRRVAEHAHLLHRAKMPA
jgi:NAD(P)H dehydrogenase (quinone)